MALISYPQTVSEHLLSIYPGTLQQVAAWRDNGQWDMIEKRHDFIQILFPTRQAGTTNKSIVLSNTDIYDLSRNSYFIGMLANALEVMLDFYGLSPDVTVIDNARYQLYFIQGGHGRHNHLRITRIMTCLRLMNLPQLYTAVKEAAVYTASAYPNSVSAATANFWQKA